MGSLIPDHKTKVLDVKNSVCQVRGVLPVSGNAICVFPWTIFAHYCVLFVCIHCVYTRKKKNVYRKG